MSGKLETHFFGHAKNVACSGTKSKIPKKLFIKTKRKGPIMTKFKDEGINSPRVTLTSLFSDLQRLSDSV